MFKKMFSNFTMRSLDRMCVIVQKIFTKTFKKVIVNDQQIQRLKQVFASRKGSIVFTPTHRSYVDFLVLSTILYIYGMEVPMICAGEDFLSMPLIGDMLRGCGAFFMRRTFRGDDLYKAIFYEYVRFLNKDRQIMEFFIEGTRARTNKTMPPKYGFLSVCTKVFFEKDVEDITIIPVTINYTRTLEDESFPGELRGEQKVKESFSRVVAATDILMMNYGTILIDFCEPISVSDYTKQKMQVMPQFNPFTSREDQLQLNAVLAQDIVLELKKKIRMMPTTMVASIILLFRRGISRDELSKHIEWMSMLINERGANFGNDVGLPGQNTMKIGLEHLKNYLEFKGKMISPKILPNGDHKNFIMLYYYRNPLSSIFFNEGLVLVAMHSFGLEHSWQTGVPLDQLFERACFLAELLEHEEYMDKRITPESRPFFDNLIRFMIDKRVLIMKERDEASNMVLFRTSAESKINFIQSMVFPIVDSYYITLFYILTFVKNKGIDRKSFCEKVQWLGELLHKQGAIQYFESCNQASFSNALTKFIEKGVLSKTGMYVQLKDEFQENEQQIMLMLSEINDFRFIQPTGDLLKQFDPN